MRRRFKIIGALLAAALLAAACSSSSSSSPSSASGPTGTLTLDNESGGTWACGFNPFNLSYIGFSLGNIYEPLVFVNTLQGDKTTPWLATSYAWSNGNKTLTFTIRKGVKFSNGDPLTPADVVYTFDQLKTHKTLDINSVWSVLSSVAQSGSDQVVMQFKAAAVPYFYYIADQIGIVDQKVWSKIANPVTDLVKNPVGTGAYTMSKCTPQNITYKANPTYWQPGMPKVKTVQYPAYTSNNTANDDLANGSAQWGGQYIPGIKEFYTSKSPDYHYWFPPTVNVTLIPNLTDPQLKNVKVRQAISYAINRTQVSNTGESGYEPPANQTGIVTPTFSSSLNQPALSAWGNGYDQAKAKSLLAQAGYHMSGGVMTNAAGQKLAFTVNNIGDYSDWVASMQVIQQNLAAVGIKLTPRNLSNPDHVNDLNYGKFQLAFYDQQSFGPSAYYELNNWLNSANTAPIGKQAATNYERYSNKSTDALLNQYATTTSASEQQSILNKLQEVMLNDVPVIPVIEAVDWYQYDTGTFSGWPTQGNPFTQPAPYAWPDLEQVLLHLAPK